MRFNKRTRTSQILRNTSKSEHKLYQVNFKTGEFSVIGATHPKTIQHNEEIFQSQFSRSTSTGERAEINHSTGYRKQPHEYYMQNPKTIKRDKIAETMIMVENFFRDNFLLLMFLMFLVFIFSQNVFARNPQGEFSALVENNKTRKDFKNKKEMMKYVKKKEKAFETSNRKGK